MATGNRQKSKTDAIVQRTINVYLPTFEMQNNHPLVTILQFPYSAQKLPVYVHLWFYGLVVEECSFHHRIKMPVSYPFPSCPLAVFSVEVKARVIVEDHQGTYHYEVSSRH